MNNCKGTDNDEVLQWYVDMIENYPNTLIHYLSDDVFLRWFGRSVIGPDKILQFIRTFMFGVKHTGFKNIVETETLFSDSMMDSTEYFPFTNQTQLFSTPETNISTINFNLSERDYLAGGDGPMINQISLKRKTDQEKKTKDVTMFEAKGAIEFGRSSYKKDLKETKCKRPCFLKISYIGSLAKPLEFNITSIIYGDNMTCQRNLLPEFDECIKD